MFFVIIYSVIDQGYIGLSSASCHKDDIWDLGAELGLIWDHFRALVPIGTKSEIWDIITSTVLVIWIFSFPRPKFSETETETFFRDQIFLKPKLRLFFRNQIFRNRDRDFFPRPIFLGQNPFRIIWSRFRFRKIWSQKKKSRFWSRRIWSRKKSLGFCFGKLGLGKEKIKIT